MKLNIGCGRHKLAGYVNIDANAKVKPDHNSDSRKLVKNFGKNVADEICAYHMIEHFSQADALVVLRNCFVVLKAGGRLYLELPDFPGILQEYLVHLGKKPIILKQRIFGLQTTEFDFHKWGYSYLELKEELEKLGFVKVKKMTPHHKGHQGPCLALEAFKAC